MASYSCGKMRCLGNRHATTNRCLPSCQSARATVHSNDRSDPADIWMVDPGGGNFGTGTTLWESAVRSRRPFASLGLRLLVYPHILPRRFVRSVYTRAVPRPKMPAPTQIDAAPSLPSTVFTGLKCLLRPRFHADNPVAQ